MGARIEKVAGVGGQRVRIGIVAPASVRIRRKEVVERDACLAELQPVH